MDSQEVKPRQLELQAVETCRCLVEHLKAKRPPGLVKRQLELLVVSEKEMSTCLHSPVASAAITLIVGCGLSIMLRMMQILCVITFRTIKDHKAKEMEYTIIHDRIEDDETPTSAPPYAHIDVPCLEIGELSWRAWHLLQTAERRGRA